MGRLDAGHWCWVARYKGQLISVSWAAIHQNYNPYLVCEILLAQDEVYVYDAFTRPDFRSRGVLPMILAGGIGTFAPPATAG
jgi:hypothetical protein